MKSLSLPAVTATEVINACIDSVRDTAIKANLNAARGTIATAEAEYIHCGDEMSLFEISATADVGGHLSGEDMKRLYANTFVKSQRTRHMYNTIKNAPENDMCPLCSQRTVSTLDHYLAQSLHASLALVPANLVPACAECNKAKLNRQPTSFGEQSFHPYFDNCDDEQWLKAIVQESTPASLHFHVMAPPGWTASKYTRAQAHFEMFRLGSLYASHAAVELTNIRHLLKRLAKRGTTDNLKSFLVEQAESSRIAYKNGWRTAMYEAISQSDWYCAGGFEAE